MPQSETLPEVEPSGVEVLTLSEAATFLRTSEDAVVALVEKGTLPAQRIGQEWRFLKRALVDFLRFGPQFTHEFGRYPPQWMLDHPMWEDLFRLLERRILAKLPTSPGPGTKQAALKHFGVFKDDDDIEIQLARLEAMRVIEE